MPSYVPPATPDITESIPTLISARIGPPIYVNKKTIADIAINDLGFLLAIDDENTYQRQTADFQRQQIDTSKEPGEQTLSQWWTRGQNSWHRGSGVNFYEPTEDAGTEYRSANTMGIDIWTQGQASLLHQTPLLVTATAGQGVYLTSGVLSGVNVFYANLGGQLLRHDGTTRTNYTGTTSLSFEPTLTGQSIICGATNGIWAGAATGTTLTNLWTSTSTTPVRTWWVKSRIIAAQGPVLYELTLAGGALNTSTPLFTHPDPNWTWSGVTEAPAAIMAAGYSNGIGLIYQFVLTDAGTNLTATLGSAIQIADFPPGEEVHAIKSYLGQYIGIGTSKGLRIGVMTSNYTITGVNISYGPLVIPTTQPVQCLSADDRFVYAGIAGDLDGNSGLARCDLSQPIPENDGRYAWAYDAQCHTSGTVQSVSFLGVSGRVAYTIQGKGVFLESATLYEGSGYIVSGKVRFGTSEPKTFNLLKIRGSIPDGDGIAVDTVDEQSVDIFLSRLTSAWDTSQDLSLRTISDTGQEFASVKLTLDSGSTNLTTPVLRSTQLKGIPKPHIQRQIQYPLRLVDVEQDRNGIKSGKVGGAYARLAALEDLEQSRGTVLVRDFTNGEAYTGEIIQVAFKRDTPPSRNRGNFGGMITLTVLKL